MSLHLIALSSLTVEMSILEEGKKKTMPDSKRDERSAWDKIFPLQVGERVQILSYLGSKHIQMEVIGSLGIVTEVRDKYHILVTYGINSQKLQTYFMESDLRRIYS